MSDSRLKLPSFHHNVEDWLVHANTSATDKEKFTALVGAFPTEVAMLVLDVTTLPLDGKWFATLKAALRSCYRKPDHEHLHDLQALTLCGYEIFLTQYSSVCTYRNYNRKSGLHSLLLTKPLWTAITPL